MMRSMMKKCGVIAVGAVAGLGCSQLAGQEVQNALAALLQLQLMPDARLHVDPVPSDGAGGQPKPEVHDNSGSTDVYEDGIGCVPDGRASEGPEKQNKGPAQQTAVHVDPFVQSDDADGQPEACAASAFPKKARIFSIADLHGDYNVAVKLLKYFGLITEDLGRDGCPKSDPVLKYEKGKIGGPQDANDRSLYHPRCYKWIGEPGDVLVFTGDIIDRAHYPWAIYELICSLQDQAKDGRRNEVVLLLGNHEILRLAGLTVDDAGDAVALDEGSEDWPVGMTAAKYLSQMLLKEGRGKLMYFNEDSKALYAHAGVTPKQAESWKGKATLPKDEILWKNWLASSRRATMVNVDLEKIEFTEGFKFSARNDVFYKDFADLAGPAVAAQLDAIAAEEVASAAQPSIIRKEDPTIIYSTFGNLILGAGTSLTEFQEQSLVWVRGPPKKTEQVCPPGGWANMQEALGLRAVMEDMVVGHDLSFEGPRLDRCGGHFLMMDTGMSQYYRNKHEGTRISALLHEVDNHEKKWIVFESDPLAKGEMWNGRDIKMRFV